MKRSRFYVATAIAICFFLAWSVGEPLIRVYADEVFEEHMEDSDTEEDDFSEIAFDEPSEVITEPEIPEPPAEPDPREPELPEPYMDMEGLTLASIEDEYTLTYQDGDGGFSTWFYSERQAFEDEDGTLTLFDNTLEKASPHFAPFGLAFGRSGQPLQSSHYENAEADFTAIFPEIITDTHGVSLEKDGYKVELIPLEGDFSRSAVKENAIRYTEVLPGIDYQYTLIGDTIKEDIILNQYVGAPSFEFELKFEGLTAELIDNVVCIFAQGEADPVFLLAVPEMVDASGEASNKIAQNLREEGGKTILTVTPDAAWLADLSRAYPVKVDPTLTINGNSLRLVLVNSYGPDETNGNVANVGTGPVGYDDGVKTDTYPWPFLQCRLYAQVSYNFSAAIPEEAEISNATFSLRQTTTHSNGDTTFRLSAVDSSWGRTTITWNNKPNSNTFIDDKTARRSAGNITWENVGDIVNAWRLGHRANNGLMLRSRIENSTAQCEVFRASSDGTNPPTLTVDWYIPDPVPEDLDIDATTVNLRPITEKASTGLQILHGVFADGEARPASMIDYRLLPDDIRGWTTSRFSYMFPNSSEWTGDDGLYPNGWKYENKLSNWQSDLFHGLDLGVEYRIAAKATYPTFAPFEFVGTEKESDSFLVYRSENFDTLPRIAKHYGVPLKTIMADNRVQDELMVEGNTFFIRNPQTDAPYNYKPLSDNDKRAIDANLMGRGLHCEFNFEPINLNTGNFFMEQEDASIPEIAGDFSISRTYNNLDDNYQSVFGRRWSFGYAESLSKQEDGAIIYAASDGKKLNFTPNGAGGYTSPAGHFLNLARIPYTVLIAGEGDADDEIITLYRYEISERSGAMKKFNAWGLMTEDISPEGLVTSIAYDEEYNIKSITSPTEKTYVFTTDSFGRFVSIAQPDGGVMRYEYDGAGHLVKYTDAAGGVTRYVYDGYGNMIEWYDPNGNRVVRNFYDDRGRVTRQYDAEWNVVTLSYAETATTTVDAEGNVAVYTIDGQKRTKEIEFPDDDSIVREYNAANLLVRDGDMRYEYDSRGNRTKDIRIDGSFRTYEYGAGHQPVRITDYDGSVTEFEYGSAGELTKATRPDGAFERIAYDAYRRPVRLTSIDGTETAYAYDGAVITSVTERDGSVWRFGYDAMNRCVSVEDPTGGIWRKTYDKAGRVTVEQSPDGAVTSYTLDATGSAVSVTDPRGYRTDVVLNPRMEILEIVGPLGIVASFTYDKNGNVSTEADAVGNITSYFYDSKNRLVREEGTAGAFTEYVYDEKGRLKERRDDRGAALYYTYDEALNLPVSVANHEGSVTSYGYDAVGKLLSIENPDGTMELFEYLASGAISKHTDPYGKTSEFTYTGRDFQATVTENGQRLHIYEYDVLGNVIKGIDPLGNETLYEYDRVSRLTRMTDPLGAETSAEYDAAGRLVKLTGANGGVSRLEYDMAGNLIRLTNAGGHTTSYVYDEAGRLASEIDAMGGVTNYAYNAVGHLASVTDALGGKKAYTYGPLNLPVTLTDENGNVSRIEYDASGNPLRITIPSGATHEMNYDAMSRLTSQTDVMGVVTNWGYDSIGRLENMSNTLGDTMDYTYDEYGRFLKAVDVLGRVEERTYDSFSQVIRQRDLDGSITEMEYDALGRHIKTVYEDGAYVSYGFDSAGNLVRERKRNGGIYTYVYDALGNTVSKRDPLGVESLYAYDALGNMTAFTDPAGAVTTYEHDALSRRTSSISPLGNKYVWAYDALSRVVSEKSPEGGTWGYDYDPVGNMVKAVDPVGNVHEFAYDEVNRLIKETAPRGGERLYEYDARGRLVSETDPLGNRTEYSLSPDGLVTEMKQANGGTFRYSYDMAKRIESVTSPLGLVRTFSYDGRGNLAQETDSLGRTSAYAYDVMGNLTGVTNPLGIETALAYDTSGNIVSVTAGNGGVTTNAYDILDRLTRTVDAEGHVTELQYDTAGRASAITLPGLHTWEFSYDAEGKQVSTQNPLGYVSFAEYDRDGRVASETDALGGSTSYAYDLLGRVTGVTDVAGITTSLGYDEDSNVTEVMDGLLGRTTFGYDLAGNLTSVGFGGGKRVGYEYDGMNNLVQATDAEGKTTSYGYDLVGNLTSITNPAGEAQTFIYDIAGRLTQAISPSGKAIRYDYSKLNELVAKSYEDDERQNVEYMYDAVGNRISMADVGGESSYENDLLGRITKATDADGRSIEYAYGENGQVSKIVYPDGSAVVYGYDAMGNLAEVTDENGTAEYEYDALGRPISLVRWDGITTAYEYDGRGNLTKLTNTSAGGALISAFEYGYDALGRIVNENETGARGAETVREFEYGLAGELVLFLERAGTTHMRHEYTYDGAGNRIGLKKTSGTRVETIAYEYDEADRLVHETSVTTRLGSDIPLAKPVETVYEYDSDGNLSQKSQGKAITTYEYTVESRLKAVREGGRLLMAASYDGDGNRVLQINRRSRNLPLEAVAGPWREAEGATGRAERAERSGSVGDDDDDHDPVPGVVLPLRDGTDGTVQDAILADSDSDIGDVNLLHVFLYGAFRYIRSLLFLIPPDRSALWKGIEGADVSDVLDEGWFRETAVSTGLSQQNVERIEAIGLTDKEVQAILSARIPMEYTGYRSEGTYELTHYVNDANREHAEVLMEYMGIGSVKARYTYGLERLSTSNAAAAGVRGRMVTASYIMDGRRSVSSLASSATGNMLARYSYSPFGETTAVATNRNGRASYAIRDNIYAYNGEPYDPGTGLQYLRARHYDPKMGRFHVADTYLGNIYDPLSRNLYAYVKNDPVNHIDPSGRNLETIRHINGTLMATASINYKGTSYVVIAPSVNIKMSVEYAMRGDFATPTNHFGAKFQTAGSYSYQVTYSNPASAAEVAAVARMTEAERRRFIAATAEERRLLVNAQYCDGTLDRVTTNPGSGGGASGPGLSGSTRFTEEYIQAIIDGFNDATGPSSNLHCVALTKWFVDNMVPGVFYNNGNGGDVARNLTLKNPWLEVTNTPVVGAIFSSKEPAWGAVTPNPAGGLYGHTGIVVGVRTDENNRIWVEVVHTYVGVSGAIRHEYELKSDHKVDFVDLSKSLTGLNLLA
ncbi:MAG: DNRLRE domain-containing protein [Clostridiales bacterium]|nr:DNRLRE domain-containing protein [Clostridiales bacterium]